MQTAPAYRPTRLAVRALILIERRLLLVNAYADGASDLWCTPGGGVEPGSSLTDNLVREVHEETGLTIRPGEIAAVSEFHDPGDGFHQVELFFRTEVVAGALDDAWRDPAAVVSRRRLFAAEDLAGVRFKPAFLQDLPFTSGRGLSVPVLEHRAP